MEGLYLGSSMLAAFVAGSVALFAPCCIGFMFPSYLAAAVRNRRYRLVPLTLVFAAGLGVVLIPLTLGAGLLARSLLGLHDVVYVAGGGLMLVLALLSLRGTTWSLPFLTRSPDLQRTDSAGVFALGLFSGAASSCCAPVLVGVVTLSTLSPSVAYGLWIGGAYVFGMVFPLFVLTLLWDRRRPEGWTRLGHRRVTLRLFGRRWQTSVTDLVSSGLFAVMGATLVVVGATGTDLTVDAQSRIAGRIQEFLRPAVEALSPIPDWAVGLGLVVFAAAAVRASGRRRPDPKPQEERCHDTTEDIDEVPEAH